MTQGIVKVVVRVVIMVVIIIRLLIIIVVIMVLVLRQEGLGLRFAFLVNGGSVADVRSE